MVSWSRVKEGARQLTPLQLLSAKRIGFIGQCIGLLIGLGMLLYLGFWYWSPFIVFTLMVQVVELVQVSQQIGRIREVNRV